MEQNTGPELASQIVKMELFNIKNVTKVVVQVMKLAIYVNMYICVWVHTVLLYVAT